ncbi:MAG: hypothetical protein EOM26_02805 [Alphaproteobacteria bacterium]|nr:hypothetical protein [Alphaproteobacteria bacterium]
MKLEPGIASDPVTGEARLYFPFMSVSDIHWGTKYSRAKRLCHMLEHTRCDTMTMVGDIVDLIALRRKERWNFGPYHRLGMAHVLEKAVSGTDVHIIDGNHEEGVRGEPASGDGRPHRDLNGKNIFGLWFHDHVEYEMPDEAANRFLILHGDQFDGKISYLYGVGDLAYTAAYEIDDLLHKMGVREDFSIAAWGKRQVKSFIKHHLSAGKGLADAVDANRFLQGGVYGHEHMAGFARTKEGKLLINDGCCTEHVQALVHDEKGNWAIITWHKDRMDVLEPDGNFETVYWKDMGLETFERPPSVFENEYTQRADRLLRLIYRAAPPKERLRAMNELRRQESLVADYQRAAGGVPEPKLLARAEGRLDTLRSQLAIPVPRHRRGESGTGTIRTATAATSFRIEPALQALEA